MDAGSQVPEALESKQESFRGMNKLLSKHKARSRQLVIDLSRENVIFGLVTNTTRLGRGKFRHESRRRRSNWHCQTHPSCSLLPLLALAAPLRYSST